MQQEIAQVVVGFIEAKRPIPGDSLQEKLGCAYLDEGLLDSMELVDLVVFVEQHFGVRLEPEDLQSESFRTVAGVVDAVQRRQSKLG